MAMMKFQIVKKLFSKINKARVAYFREFMAVFDLCNALGVLTSDEFAEFNRC